MIQGLLKNSPITGAYQYKIILPRYIYSETSITPTSISRIFDNSEECLDHISICTCNFFYNSNFMFVPVRSKLLRFHCIILWLGRIDQSVFDRSVIKLSTKKCYCTTSNTYIVMPGKKNYIDLHVMTVRHNINIIL